MYNLDTVVMHADRFT